MAKINSHGVAEAVRIPLLWNHHFIRKPSILATFLIISTASENERMGCIMKINQRPSHSAKQLAFT